MLQTHRVRHMLHLSASGERKQRGQQEEKLGCDQKRWKRTRGVGGCPAADRIPPQPGAASAPRSTAPQEPTFPRARRGRQHDGTHERTPDLLPSTKARLGLRSPGDCQSV